MKRLIKESKFFNSVKRYMGKSDNDEVFDCYINPTSKDWSEITKTDPNRSVRCLAMQDGTVYAWIAELPHYKAIEVFKLPNNGEHITGEANNIRHLCSQPYTTPETLKNVFTNCTSLYNYFSKNTVVHVDTYCNNVKNYEEYESFNTIEDIINVKILTKV